MCRAETSPSYDRVVRRLALGLAISILVACGCAATPSPSAARGTADPARAARFGVAGVIPPNADHAAAADYETLYRSFAETGGLVGVYTNWSDAVTNEGKIPKVVDDMFAAGKRYGFTPLVALGVTHDAVSTVTATISWDNAEQRRRFINVAVAVAKTYQPAYLALGLEVNRLARDDPASFEGFVSAYREAYAAIKAASPSTAVFTVFQLERLRGAGYVSTGTRASPARWDLLDRFSGALDVVGFTTYPFLDYESPAAVPPDYYSSIAARVKAPIAFTEIGWPSAPLAAAPASGFGGTPEEQASFVKRFFDLTATLKPAFSLWSFPNDPGPAAATFASVGLRQRDGTPKPALAAWREGIAAP
ncbi:MAG: hypothetical protein AUH85_10175 [Chloroflexi bacterium 13_1_40CM_4_68_4]|nr:MAG: hypothetical protein AUH85_10175 [Chloroflexi bacterium 13_1_40CM_4_68_4]